MKCSSLVLLAAASILNVSASNIVKECNTPGHVALIVDGFASADGPKLLSALKTEQIHALVTIPQVMLVGTDNFNLVDGVKKAGHELGYRFTIDDKVALLALKDEDILKEFEDVKTRFADIHQTKIKYVMFPYTEDKQLQKRFAGVADRAGLTAVGHSMYLGLEHSKAKDAIVQNLYHAKNKAYIALLEGNAAGQEATLKFYRERINKGEFQAVSMTTCLSGAVKQNNKKHGISSKLIIGQAKSNGAKYEKTSHHKKNGKKHSSKKSKKEKTNAKKQGVLVNPGLIKGFKKVTTAAKKHDKLVDSDEVDKKSVDAQKMHAKKNKDFEMNNPEPIELKANALKNKDEEAKEAKKEDENKKVAAKEENAAVSLSAGTTTLVIAIVAGLVASL